ncbi:hypothetical protein KSZ_51290 [Dictyobacter formicarum]|uniref:Integrase catalytic domain-containing protein n=1 Tax=Dictyobacter formicarum TaxID=2778368 RepID=A0ABQ3VP19_9CHLR|nr:hypothetical protein KSZ_51290 [Dictyobacter formicarum]
MAGLEPKSRARKGPRKVTLKVTNEVRKLQKNPLLGKWRMHTTLKRLGIEVSPATCARIMAANRQIYGIEKPPRSPRLKREMPFKASRRHEYWSCDVRYIEEHLLENPRPVYVITIFENFSRMVLSSTISRTQNQWDYLMVLADAIRRYGAPEAIVTDEGGIFYAHVALELYEMLGIRKERIRSWGTIEYQATMLSEYTLHFSPDHKNIEAVKNPRRIETSFRSPQLHLWQRGETSWLLVMPQPARHKRKMKRSDDSVVQLRFPEMNDQKADAAL